ncbi:redox-sensing transcriptional repressor Rex [Gottschalkia purinilytica]|uniref:Redox-sensing transcriptional repressor Rex n=2 Tax=Gottschalkia purinilytica TaxID=1503 RepID=A0A0L0WDW5_GOTPU|nr:redox-sensing transcriptional repressor Rex [Gottschalkia purinilytica]
MAVIRRLPKYHRYLGELLEKDVTRISSYELSKLTGFTASQIRQDFNNFGGFGQQGYGYNVEDLYNQLGNILGLGKKYNTIIIGAGNLGQAIANYKSFDDKGFRMLALFEKNPKLVGLTIRDIDILDIDSIESFSKENKIDIAVITTPKSQAQDVVNRVVNCGVKAIWNFAPIDLKVPEDVVVENVQLSESLLTIAFLLKEKEENV